MHPAIKICGLTNEADAFTAAQLGAHYLGYILYAPGSPRAVTVAAVAPIIRRVRTVYPAVQHVGVFVNATVEFVQAGQRLLSLDVVQLHGEESVEVVRTVSARCPAAVKIWKSIILRAPADLEQIARYEPYVTALQVDAGQGSGQMIPAELLALVSTTKPVVIAGGITPATLPTVLSYQPAVIDVSSGVEVVSGKKDRMLIQQLMQACYAAAD